MRDERRGLAHATLTGVATVVVVRVARRVIVRVLLCVVVAERAARHAKERDFGSVSASRIQRRESTVTRRDIQNSIESVDAGNICFQHQSPRAASQRDATRARTHQAVEQFDPGGSVESIVDGAPFVP